MSTGDARGDGASSRGNESIRHLSAKALDLGVYLPVGLLLAARQELPRLTERGRQTVEQRLMVARFVGTIAAQQGRREIERRLSGLARRSTTPPGPTSTGPTNTGPTSTGSASAAAEQVSDTRSGMAPDPALPIGDYTSLSATQIIGLLADLDLEELDEIERFERSTRNRRTVLNRIEAIRRRIDGSAR